MGFNINLLPIGLGGGEIRIFLENTSTKLKGAMGQRNKSYLWREQIEIDQFPLVTSYFQTNGLLLNSLALCMAAFGVKKEVSDV